VSLEQRDDVLWNDAAGEGEQLLRYGVVARCAFQDGTGSGLGAALHAGEVSSIYLQSTRGLPEGMALLFAQVAQQIPEGSLIHALSVAA